MPTDKSRLLTGVRVLDASRVLAGPLCGQILGDLGAEVIKIERPGQGDETRAWGPPFHGPFSAYFLSCNRNKKALALHLDGDGLAIFHDLVRRSDVVLENFRSASADRLGLSPSKLLALNPRLVLCSISGFGRTGPRSDVPGYDFAIQGLSGLMDITGPVEGPPSKVGVAVTDVFTGLYAATAVLACLHHRHTSGHGYAIDVALLDCALAAQVNLAQAYLTSGQVPARQGNAHLQIVPYQAFRSADDWLILAIGNDGQWQRFCQAAERTDLANDVRFATNTLRVEHRATLVPMLEEVFRTRPAHDWHERLDRAQVPHAPVWNYAQLFADPQAAARNLKITINDKDGNPVDLLGSPFHIAGAEMPPPTMPPSLGEHTSEILHDLLGMEPEKIAEYRRRGIVG